MTKKTEEQVQKSDYKRLNKKRFVKKPKKKDIFCQNIPNIAFINQNFFILLRYSKTETKALTLLLPKKW